jgi:hypothetical protein
VEKFLRMREDDFNTLSETQRDLFTYVEKVEINEYELHTKMILIIWLCIKRNQKHRRN